LYTVKALQPQRLVDSKNGDLRTLLPNPVVGVFPDWFMDLLTVGFSFALW
jgi:hypothetical protein